MNNATASAVIDDPVYGPLTYRADDGPLSLTQWSWPPINAFREIQEATDADE